MAKYWIRNRGRIQGPLTRERIQGLLRRGRFSRHFFVSTDRKEWLPAEEFPELFGGRKSSRDHDDDLDDDREFHSGGSPFDDEDDGFDERPSRSRRRKSRKPVGAFDDDEHDAAGEDSEDDSDDWDEDDWDDDEESTGLVGWIENHAKLIGGVLVACLLAASWFIFFRETFAQDQADLDALQDMHVRISTAYATGVAAQQWLELQDSVSAELSSLVSRLEKTAGATDAVKQELLFAARDDLPLMFRELPNGVQKASQRAQRRFAVIDTMIRNEVRYRSSGPPAAPAATTPASNGASPSTESRESSGGLPDENNDSRSAGSQLPVGQTPKSGEPN